MTKKIVAAGDRVYMKFFDLDYFHERAKEANAIFIPFKGFDDLKFKTAISDSSALILIDRPLKNEHIELMDRCKIVLALEVGYDFIDVESATRKGIIVSNVQTYCTDQVAVHAIMLLLAAYRKIRTLMSETNKGGWDYNIGKPIYELRDKNLGIVGLGRIGRAMLPKAKGFGMKVIAYDPYLGDDIFELLGVKRCYDLDELLAESDFMTLHVPLTEETYHMIGEKELAQMKKEAIVVNTCRGKVIEEKSFYNALRNNSIAGGGIDVLETEPPDRDNPLLNLENLIVTPHVAWYSEYSLERLKMEGMDEVVRVLNGKRPRNIINPEVLY